MLASGQPVPRADITVTLPAPVTSRLVNGNASEALLLIDEPNSGLVAVVPGFGPAEPFTICSTPASGCPAWAQQVGAGSSMYEVAVNGPNATPTPGNAAPNVYQGVVNGNQVTFFGVPILVPGPNAAHVYLITNLRMDATQVGASPGNSIPVVATVAASNASVLPLTRSDVLLGFVQPSLTASATLTPLPGCQPQALQQAAVLTYSAPADGSSSFFRTRVDPTVPGQTNGQSGLLLQNLPGYLYTSESGFTLAVPGGVAGLADFGTRFKAVFSNLPAGLRIFVSLTNVVVDPITGLAASQVAQPAPRDTVTAFAELVTGESSPFAAASSVVQTPSGNIGVVEITPPAGTGSATAVWETVNTSFVRSNFQFAVYVSYPSYSAGGTGMARLSYAPTAATGGSAALIIPRFVDTSTPVAPIQIAPCNLEGPPNLKLTGAPNPSVLGQPVTFTLTTNPRRRSCMRTRWLRPPACAMLPLPTPAIRNLRAALPRLCSAS